MKTWKLLISGLALTVCLAACSVSMAVSNDGLKLNIPSKVRKLVLVDMPKDDANGVLFSVSEKASVEAAAADGEAVEGVGWLFDIRRVDEDTLHELLCEDMSGAAVFAKDDASNYYLYTHPTDVRLYRQNNDYEKGMEEWTALNEWAWNDVRADIVKENTSLESFERGNSELDIYLARVAYRGGTQDGVPYILDTAEHGVLLPNGVDVAPFAERLMTGNGVICEEEDLNETPGGEYIVLRFPEDGLRFDFFLAEGKENYIRRIVGNNASLMKLTFPDDTKASAIVQEWCDALLTESHTPDDLVGRWTEPPTGRCLIEIGQASGTTYPVTIHWANSAFEQAVWEMTATPDETSGALRYEDAKHYIRTYTSDTEYTDEPQYENGSGTFSLNNAGELVWKDEVDDASNGSVFVKAD